MMDGSITLPRHLVEKAVEMQEQLCACHDEQSCPAVQLGKESAAELRAALAGQKPNPLPWLIAIDEAMVGAHIGVADSTDDYDTAKRKLNSLIVWHVQVALDPAVSSDAQALVDRGANSATTHPTFRIGDLVTKVSGSSWTGRVVGTYSTALTPEGYAVESETERGSVQIYPAKALAAALREALAKPDVPEGWKLVPVEPTLNMVKSGGCADTETTDSYSGGFTHCIGDDAAREAYRAMLAAVPQPKDTP